jgi:hypothetical protein
MYRQARTHGVHVPERNTTRAFQKCADGSASPVVVCLKQWAVEQPHWGDNWGDEAGYEVDSTGQHARQLSVLDTSDGMSMADACLAYVREVSASCAVQLKLQRETAMLHFELNNVDQRCVPALQMKLERCATARACNTPARDSLAHHKACCQ